MTFSVFYKERCKNFDASRHTLYVFHVLTQIRSRKTGKPHAAKRWVGGINKDSWPEYLRSAKVYIPIKYMGPRYDNPLYRLFGTLTGCIMKQNVHNFGQNCFLDPSTLEVGPID